MMRNYVKKISRKIKLLLNYGIIDMITRTLRKSFRKLDFYIIINRIAIIQY